MYVCMCVCVYVCVCRAFGLDGVWLSGGRVWVVERKEDVVGFCYSAVRYVANFPPLFANYVTLLREASKKVRRGH